MSENNYWQRLRSGRTSRRALLRASARAGVGAAGLALVGCGDDDDDEAPSSVAATREQQQSADQPAAQAATQEAQADQQAAQQDAADQDDGGQQATQQVVQQEAPLPGVYGGVLQMQDIATTDVYDPAITIAAQDMFKGFVCYDYMTNLSTYDLTVTSKMSELPEVVDDLTYIYNIKPGIRWQNIAPVHGRDFTAEDAAFGWSRFGQDNPEFTWGSKVRAVDSWDPVDTQTLRVVTKEPFAPLISLLSSDVMVMVSKEAADLHGADGMKLFENIVGTGPFMVQDFELGVRSSVVRNPDYWQKGKPYLDGFESVTVTDAAAREANILSQQVDINSGWGSDGSIQNNERFAEQIEGLGIAEKPLAAFWHITFNATGRVPAFLDPRVRRAFQLAADRSANIAAYQGNHWTMGPVPRYVGPLAWNPEELNKLPGYQSPKDDDIAEARRLIDAAGYGDGGDELKFVFRGAGFTHEVLQQNWQNLGNIEIELLAYDRATLLPLRYNAEFDMIGGSISAGSEADDFLFGWTHSTGATNYGRFDDPEVDALSEKQRTLFDFDARKAVTDELQTMLLEKSPHIYMHSWVFFQYWQPWVKNWHITTGSQVWVVGDTWLDGKPS